MTIAGLMPPPCNNSLEVWWGLAKKMVGKSVARVANNLELYCGSVISMENDSANRVAAC